MPPKFRAGTSGTRGQNTEFKSINRIVRDKVIFVPPYLSKADEGDDLIRTEIRLFPPIENGEIYPVLNPDTKGDTPLRKRLAGTFLDIEMVRGTGGLGGKGIQTDMITSVLKLDNGEDAPTSYFTPYREFVYRLQTKIKEQVQRAQIGLPQDIPRQWYRYYNEGGFREGIKFGRMPYPQGRGNVNKETGEKRPDLYIVQCLALHINGTSRKDGNGKIKWQGPCVFVIPASAAANFFDELTTRQNEDEPLTPQNCEFGDCISLKEGCTIKLKKLPDSKYVLRSGRVAPISKELVEKVYCEDWNELIVIPTVEESIKWIAEAFGDPAMVDYAFREVEDNAKSGRWYNFVPEEWRGLADEIAEPLSKEALKELVDNSGKRRDVKKQEPKVQELEEQEGEDLDALPIDEDDLDYGDGPVDDTIDDVPSGVDPDRYAQSLSDIHQQLADENDNEDFE